MFDELQLKYLCNKYKFNYKIISDTQIWYIQIEDTNQLKLLHENRKGSHKYHHQRTFRNFPFMLKSIHQHDTFKLNRGSYKMQRITKLLQKIH